MTGWDADKMRLDVARDLREVVRLWGKLGQEAIARALGHDAADLDALNLAGPACNVEAWEHRYEAAEAELTARTDYAADQTAELHPLLVLATWTDCVRDARDQPTDLRATVPREADYLAKSVDWMLSDDENGDINFLGIDQLASDLRRCIANLENVLKEGSRLDRLKIPCMWCDESPRLAIKYGRIEQEDSWFCPACRHEYDAEGVVNANHHALKFGDGWVRITDAAFSTGRSIKTLRHWATPRVPWAPVVESRRTKSDRVEIKWSEVREIHNTRNKRQRIPKTA